MPYDQTTRERIEAWPKKGTRDRLKAKAKKAKATSFSAYVAKVLEKASQ